MRPVPTQVPSPADRPRVRRLRRFNPDSKARLRRLALESLESRTMLDAALPAAVVQGQGFIQRPAAGNQDTPSVAIDPANANILVSAWTTDDPGHSINNNQTGVFVQAAYSTDKGVTWNPLFIQGDSRIDFNQGTANGPHFFSQVTDPSIAFASNGDLYLTLSPHTGDYSSGEVLLQKFTFNGTNFVSDTFSGGSAVSPIYQWTQDPAFRPTLAVDANQMAATDSNPAFPGQTYAQADPFAGNVYVAWSTNNNTSGLNNGNPNTIRLTASADGGSTFTTAQVVNQNGNFGNERDSSPRLVVSQGRPADPQHPAGVPGGQLSIVWDDSASFRVPGFNPPVDRIVSNRVQDGGTGYIASTPSNPGPINDAGPGNPVNSPGTSSFPLNVNVTDPNFSLTDLAASVSLIHNNLAEISIDLVPPAGSNLPTVRLLQNQLSNDTTKAANTGVGTTGADMGDTASGTFLGTVFDDHAPRTIHQSGGGNGTTGVFRADGGVSLDNAYRGAIAGAPNSPNSINGQWTLVVTDYRATNPTPNPAPRLVDFTLNFTSGLTPGQDTTVATTTLQGTTGVGAYPTGSSTSPLGIGPGAVIASDNTLGAFSPNQGRLYVAYVGAGGIDLATSDDGGLTWQPGHGGSPINDDNPTRDGFSGGNRPKLQPSIALDQATGSVVVSWYDARYDAAAARVGTFVSASIDGGNTFSPNVFANAPDQATDAITGQTIVRGPLPDNQSPGDAARDTTFGYGDHQGLAAFGGQVYPVWAGNLNGGVDGKQTLGIIAARVNIASGPRILGGTMGPIGLPGDPLNTTRAADGTPQVNEFQVTFDRPIDPNTFTGADVRILYQAADPSQPPVSIGDSTTIAVNPVPVAGDPNNDGYYGYMSFLVTFPPQSGVGTYSYEILPGGISDRVESINSGATSRGNGMDQAANGTAGAPFAVPQPTGTQAPGTSGTYNQDTLPMILPGPRVATTFAHVAGQSAGGGLVPAGTPVADGTVDGLVVVFDRDMDPATFSGAAVARVLGPAGLVPGPFTFTPDPNADPGNPDQPGHARHFLIGFPAAQALSGTYTVNFGVTATATLKDARGNALDENLNAGLYILDPSRNPSGATTTETIPAPITTPLPIPDATSSTAGGVTTVTPGTPLVSTITVPDDFVVRGLTLQLNIAHPFDPDLVATLIAPDGTAVRLFTNVGNTGNPKNTANFTNTVFDDATFPITPIQDKAAPFFGHYNPQESLTSALITNHLVNGQPAPPIRSGGNWTLVVQDTAHPGQSGTLNSWSLTFTKDVPNNGLGEPVADQASASFRIFTMSPTNQLASSVWTAVGPASIGGGGAAGDPESGGVDPSDPSGNTVFLGGASGGVWKTTNFLDPAGPTWVPLTDFGPAFAINIGSIAVFPRNNDPNQSIVIAATGEGDGNFGASNGQTNLGVGFLRSMDGGATWTLLDSTDNTLPATAPAGSPAGTPVRDHAFVGSSAFKVVVDPTSTPGAGVTIYAALYGRNGGIWVSHDTGQTWGVLNVGTGKRAANLAGNATDVVLDPNSGTGGPNGNLQIVYAALAGQGVFFSPNQGQVWNPMPGGIGNPLIQDSSTGNPVPVTAGPAPNGGRILLAKPYLTGNAAEDLNFEGWLWVGVMDGTSHFQGLYVTKDFGQNWTKVGIPTLSSTVTNGVTSPRAVPNNNPNNPNYDLGGGPAGTGLPSQGLYDFSMAIDPTNPNVLYLGGTQDGQPTGFIRVDATGITDAHALVPFNNQLPDNGLLQVNTNGEGPISLKDPTKPVTPKAYFNFLRDPTQPFVADAIVPVGNVSKFNNAQAVAKWIPFDIGGTDQHRIVTFVDPLTHHARLIIGDDQGVYTAVDKNGTFSAGIGTAPFPTSDRNGNLQITQFYYGASQPSNLAAQVAGALFYGSAQDDGGPTSTGGLLTPGDPDYGNITWGGPGGDATGVATDQQGNGTLYQYWWPCCGGNGSDFFQVDGVGRTFGLIQQSNPGPVPDPQWPSTGGSNFTVNPLSGQQIVISSQAGRIFSTENQGIFWSVIGNPGALDGSYAPALTYGAPDPNGPAGIGNFDNFLYAGTSAGHIYVTQTGGGGNGNAWTNISQGLSGGGVQMIVTDPTRGSHRAYAVTSGGVFYDANSVQTSPGAPAATGWVNISGNLFQILQNAFGDPSLASQKLQNLTSIQADWRYVIPDDPTNPNSPTHPLLYVGGQGGVFRSFDNGKTWTSFPSVADGSPVDGGYLPVADVTDLGLALGAINPNTGRAEPKPGDPNILLATTYGRGQFAIRLAPIIFSTLAGINVAPVASTSPQLTVTGFSEQTAIGNTVTVNLIDETPGDPQFGRVIGSGPTDASGHFSVQVNPGSFTTPGNKLIGVQATDGSGTAGNLITLTFARNFLTTLSTPTLDQVSVTAPVPGTPITGAANPTFDVAGTAQAPATIQLLRKAHDPNNLNDPNPADYTVVGAVAASGAASVTIVDANGGAPVPDGQYDYVSEQVDPAGDTSPLSAALVLTIDTGPPAQPSAPVLSSADATGTYNGAATTNVSEPHLVGTVAAEANPSPGETPPFVQVVADVKGTLTVLGLAQATAQTGGGYTYSVQIGLFAPLADGTYSVQARAIDAAGNASAFVSASPVIIDTSTPRQPSLPVLSPADNHGNRTGNNQPHLIGTVPLLASPEPPPLVQIVQLNAQGQVVNVLGVAQQADASGHYSDQAGLPTSLGFVPLPDGTYTVGARAISIAGNVGPLSAGSYTFTVTTTKPIPATIVGLLPQDDTGISNTDNVTKNPQPHVFGLAASNTAGITVDLLRVDTTKAPSDPAYIVGAPLAANVPVAFNGSSTNGYTIAPQTPLASGTYNVVVRTRDALGNTSLSAPLTLTIQTQAPKTVPVLYLYPFDDTGVRGDNATSLRRPRFFGFADPGSVIELVDAANPNGPAKTLALAGPNGMFVTQLPADLSNGTVSLVAREGDVAGNLGAPSATLTVSIVTTPGDYFGDGKADFATYDPATGNWGVMSQSGQTKSLAGFGAPGLDVPVQGDFNGDGVTDFATYRPTNALFSILYSGGGGALIPVGTPNSIPEPANYEGPGKTDPASYDPRTGIWTIFKANANTIVQASIPTAVPSDIPAPADYDGDGKVDLAVYRPSTGIFIILNSSTNTVSYAAVGTPNSGDLPIPGNYDGTAKADPATFRPSDAVWRMLFQNGSIGQVQFGSPGDSPTPVDFTGVGVSDLAIFHPSPTGGSWAVIRPGVGGEIVPSGGAGNIFAVPTSPAFRTPGAAPAAAVRVQSVAPAEVVAPAAAGTALDFGRQAARLSASSSVTPASATATVARSVVPQATIKAPASSSRVLRPSRHRLVGHASHGHARP